MCFDLLAQRIRSPESRLPGKGTERLIACLVALCYHCFVSQPVKLSDALVLDARLTAEVAERSIAGQIEFWARLGRAVEPLLQGDKTLALRKSGDERSLSELISSVDQAVGRSRVVDYLESQPFPHYEPVPDQPGLLIRTEEDGTQVVGKFAQREFVPVKKKSRPSPVKKKAKKKSR
ncbi:MAG: hypothetical protein KDB27_24995 [Planctomycetales bacterium]|nr:hypothetical protein [Planctomycetales bacterium]